MIFSPADSSVSESPQSSDGQPVYAEIPFRVERDKILITIRIANTDRTFLVDTGAPFMIDAALAAEMGYAPVGAKNLKDAAGNTARVNALRVPELVLGDIRFSNLQALVYDFRNSLLGCFGIDGIIGSNLLQQSVIQFDWKESKMIITDSASRLDLDMRDAIKIRISAKQSSPFVPVWIQDKLLIWSLLDTGSDDFFTISQRNLSASQKQGLLTGLPLSRSTGSAALGLIGGKDESFELLLDGGSLHIGPVRIADQVAIESNLDDDSRVGMKLLERGRLTLDYKKKRLWFYPYTDMPDYDYNNFGIGFIPEADHWIIREVWSGSDAERWGIALGDTLIQYGEIDMLEESVCKVLFQLPAERNGDSLRVVVRHINPAREEQYTLSRMTLTSDQ